MKIFRLQIIIMVTLILLAITAIALTPDCEAQTTTTRGYVDGERVKTKTTTKADGSTVTRGYIGGKRVKTKSTTTAAGTKTTGYIGSQRVRVKTKPD
jgi:hypothetical protein